MRRGTTRNPTSAAAAIAPKVAGSNQDLFAVCFAAVDISAALGVGASELELSLALALALTARSAACCAAYACTFRRTHSPGRPGSSAVKRR
jgi:heme A synthase